MYICELASVYLYVFYDCVCVCWSVCTCLYAVVVGRLVCLHMHFLGGMPLPYAFVCMRVCFCVCFWLCVFLHVNMFRCGYLGNILVQE